jgi:hypothetical protein
MAFLPSQQMTLKTTSSSPAPAHAGALQVADQLRCDEVLQHVHDTLGHKGYYATSMLCTLLDRFWWRLIVHNIRQYITTCRRLPLYRTVRV